MTSVSVAGLLLAAGGGSRMGRAKALVEWRGSTLVEHGIGLLRQAELAPVLVVVGAAADEVGPLVQTAGGEVVANDAWQRGMSASLQAGLAAVAQTDRDAVVVSLVDQPLVEPAAVQRLVGRWRADPHVVAVVAAYDGRPRTPVLLDRRVWAEVAARSTGDEGARAWLRPRLEVGDPSVVTVDCDDVASPLDLDRPEDLSRLDA